jgi:DUF4097 and DUF4098 domain-containing protein YvlB
MVMKRSALTVMAILAAPAWLVAQTPVDERRDAAADGVVEIENLAGSVKVVGWAETAVRVTGTLAAGAELDFQASGERTQIEVEVDDDNPIEAVSDLEVHVPAGSHVEIGGVRLDIEVAGVTGSVEAETVDGSILHTGAAKEVALQSVTGTVDVTDARGLIQAETVNGAIHIRSSSGQLEAATVNGELVVTDGPFDRVALESVAGTVRYEADLTAQARLDVETVSGSVEIFVASDINVDVSISTFSGGIDSEFDIGTIEQESFLPAKELTFSTGAGGARITVETLSGRVHLRKR